MSFLIRHLQPTVHGKGLTGRSPSCGMVVKCPDIVNYPRNVLQPKLWQCSKETLLELLACIQELKMG